MLYRNTMTDQSVSLKFKTADAAMPSRIGASPGRLANGIDEGNYCEMQCS